MSIEEWADHLHRLNKSILYMPSTAASTHEWLLGSGRETVSHCSIVAVAATLSHCSGSGSLSIGNGSDSRRVHYYRITSAVPFGCVEQVSKLIRKDSEAQANALGVTIKDALTELLKFVQGLQVGPRAPLSLAIPPSTMEEGWAACVNVVT